jgi:hypothetical protein
VVPAPVTVSFDGREMVARPPSPLVLRRWGAEGRAAPNRTRSLAVALAFLRSVLDAADFAVISTSLAQGGDEGPVCDLVLHLARAWTIDPRDVAAFN